MLLDGPYFTWMCCHCTEYSSDLFFLVFIEEAAEILEPHIIAALYNETQHLILIGKSSIDKKKYEKKIFKGLPWLLDGRMVILTFLLCFNEMNKLSSAIDH